MPHKSDMGAVALVLAMPADSITAYDAMACELEKDNLAGMLVCRHVRGGLELGPGLHRDREMGMAAMAGSGGVLLELIAGCDLPATPISREKARDMPASLRAGKLLQGYRGAPPATARPLIDGLVALGRLAADLEPELQSVDINPFVALAEWRTGTRRSGRAGAALRNRMSPACR